jgi:hypothetical protein
MEEPVGQPVDRPGSVAVRTDNRSVETKQRRRTGREVLDQVREQGIVAAGQRV